MKNNLQQLFSFRGFNFGTSAHETSAIAYPRRDWLAVLFLCTLSIVAVIVIGILAYVRDGGETFVQVEGKRVAPLDPTRLNASLSAFRAREEEHATLRARAPA